MSKQNLFGLSLIELEEIALKHGEQKYRGRQLYKWLYNNRLHDFDRMTDLSKELRAKLNDEYTIDSLSLIKKQTSKDGTEKFLFRLTDGNSIETVLIPEPERKTVCISSQVGCALACDFCATGTMGLMRNLTVGEILGQLTALRDMYGQDCFTNIVFMGMGEPLNNYENVVNSIKIMTDSAGLMIGAKKITVSTSGISPKIRKLADSGLKTMLALSLHAAIQSKRERIMPVAKTFKLEKLMQAIKYYTDKTGFRVTIEYILFDKFNDTLEDMNALTRLLHSIPCKINILAYNPVPGLNFKRPSDEKVDWFGKKLYPRLPALTIRKSRGRDIDAACGQLAGRIERSKVG